MFKNGTYKIGDRELYFRSLWEANYALYLEWLASIKEIKSWRYEPERYYFILEEKGRPKALGNGYLPDFEVTKNDGSIYLVEVKGKEQGMVKLKRMKRFYPHIKIELVDSKEYKSLNKKLGKALHFYD